MFLLDSDGKLVGTQGAPTLAFNYTDTRNLMGTAMLTLDKGDWPTEPGQIAIDSGTADKAGYRIGDTVTVVPPGAKEPVKQELVGYAGFNGGGTAGSVLLIFDTQGAQDLFLDGKDRYTSASLTGAEGVSQSELAAAAKTVLPDNFTAVTGDSVVKESKNSLQQSLSFVTTFLTVFAVIAIIVGGFIIANTFSILVAQRIRELALVRALGASRRQVTRSVLLEALLMALIGSTLGMGAGLGLALVVAALMGLLGVDVNADVLTLSWRTVAIGYAVGIVVTVASAYFPARRAAKVPPVAAMSEGAGGQQRSLTRRTVIGAAVLVVGTILAVVGTIGAPGNDAIYIGVGAVLWIITAAVISPVLGWPVLATGRAVFAKVFGVTGRLAGENALRNPRRTGATASALMIGLALASAVGVLAASMSKTTDKLVSDQFTSDFVVQSPNYSGFSPAIGDEMADIPGVATVSRQQFAQAKVDGKSQSIVAVDDTFAEVYRLDFIDGSGRVAGDTAIINESQAKKMDLSVGSTVDLVFPGDQATTVTIGGIYADSQVAEGLSVPFGVLQESGIKRTDYSLNILLAPGADKAAVQAALDDVVKDIPVVTVQDKSQFANSLKDQVNGLLFLIYGLLALAVVIAVLGIINTMSLSVIERTREIGLLRAVGLTRAKLGAIITMESVTISVMGALLGLGLGLIIGVLLQHALSDDLTELGLPIGSLIAFLVVAVLFGMIAAIIPTYRAARLKVLDAIATE